MTGFGNEQNPDSGVDSTSNNRSSKFLQKKLKLNKLGRVSQFEKFSKYVDPAGRLNFHGKAVLHRSGVDFSCGISYNINLDDLAVSEDLGKGQYGIVRKVYHIPTGVAMAMKETHLELDRRRLDQILMELDVLHKSHSPRIVDFYGAFFVESRVCYCMEYMDAGSLGILSEVQEITEPVLAKVAISMIEGLKFLKDELSIIHRDVKPSNVLMNTSGQVKLCDFGISGNLVESLAKTDIGCRIYMAPERITTKNAQYYTVHSDVWSLGISLIEMALGKYPYPFSDDESIISQLNKIVTGTPPLLPEDKYSQESQDFVKRCMQKWPTDRPGYAELLDDPWLVKYKHEIVDMDLWVKRAVKNLKKDKQNNIEDISDPSDNEMSPIQ